MPARPVPQPLCKSPVGPPPAQASACIGTSQASQASCNASKRLCHCTPRFHVVRWRQYSLPNSTNSAGMGSTCMHQERRQQQHISQTCSAHLCLASRDFQGAAHRVQPLQAQVGWPSLRATQPPPPLTSAPPGSGFACHYRNDLCLERTRSMAKAAHFRAQHRLPPHEFHPAVAMHSVSGQAAIRASRGAKSLPQFTAPALPAAALIGWAQLYRTGGSWGLQASEARPVQTRRSPSLWHDV